ncbi:putative CBL-interacting protein kinase 23 [Blattamonas nauphoetae]|uniref:non-specific serine/threonine protein kinase n=1 Tax=Blattamonas nauphoetae TaxID=2049346 RepID=A0ABQ9Y3Y9_9EUKA|nr:putative CBL-interacting protein kinase 23 [Blattamonas nauphoetae]
MATPGEQRQDQPQQLLKVNKYYIGPTLGEGTFGKVKQCKNSITNEMLAMKIIDKEKVLKHHMSDQLKREISLMKKLRHENIIRMHEVLTSKSKVFIVLELAQGGELFQKIADSGRFDEKTSRYYFQQLIRGVDFCHQNGICHRDLKPENLLLDERGVLKITDFGLCALSDADNVLLKTQCGTPNYTAPEILIGGQYDGKPTDVWSCGIILFVMLAGYLPFEEDNNVELFRKIKKAEFEYPSYFPAQPKALINKILNPSPANRMTIADIKKDPWFVHNLNPSFFDPLYSIVQMKVIDPAVEDTSAEAKPSETKPQDASKPPVQPKQASHPLQPTVTKADLQNALQPVDDVESKQPPAQTQPEPTPKPKRQKPAELTIGIDSDDKGDLPPPIQSSQLQVKNGTQFTSVLQPQVIMQRVRDEIVKLKGNIASDFDEGEDPTPSTASPFHIHAIFPKAVGVLTLKVDLFRMPTNTAFLVHFRRGKGSVVAFMTLYKQLRTNLKDVVSEEMSKPDAPLYVPRTPQGSRQVSPSHSPKISFPVSPRQGPKSPQAFTSTSPQPSKEKTARTRAVNQTPTMSIELAGDEEKTASRPVVKKGAKAAAPKTKK